MGAVVLANGIAYPVIGVISDCSGLEYIDPAKSPEAMDEYLKRGMTCIDAALNIRNDALVALGFGINIIVISSGLTLLWMNRRTTPAT
ncbi:MAG: hypothetical protein MPK62_02070 [Alphaproteobacteria bacterium]|nr:hypothetical protein [Alphaproteobacteria bacterium]